MHDEKDHKNAMLLLSSLSARMEVSNASDLHIQEGEPPYLRIVGKIYPQDDIGKLDGKIIDGIIRELLTEQAIGKLELRGAVDAGVQLQTMRLRVNVFRHHNGLAVSMRRIPSVPPGFQDLNLPAVIKKFANLTKGLVIISGPTGCGKSTTLAAIINHINSSHRAHIITIEDPIEFLHDSKTALVAQREVGKHAETFADALRDALREDPNVLLVGEMRDLETIELALRAAETGHLVFSTLHTSGAAGSLSRIVDAFEASSRDTVRVQLSLVLVGVISQLLLPTRDGKSRIPVCEVLIATNAVRHLIREGKLEQIPNIMQAGSSEGMITFSAHISELAKAGLIDAAGGLEAVGESWRVADMIFDD